MKIEIDFDQKTITLKDSVSLKELVDRLRGLELGDWKEWHVKSDKETEYIQTSPWVIPIYPNPIPYYPRPWEPIITYGDNTGSPLPELPYTICCSAIN